jgi:hypothetical protein
MFSKIPLPENISLGNRILQGMEGINALTNSNLENHKKKLENQYYAPNILSEINYRNAGTNKINTMTPLEAKELEIKNKYGDQREQANINNTNALTNKTTTMTPLEAEELKTKNEFARQREQADIDKTKAQTQLELQGGSGASASGHDRAELRNILSIEYPEWKNNPTKLNQAASAYISGSNTMPDGRVLNPPSGLVSSIVNPLNLKQDTAAGNNQKRFADTLETLFKSSDENADKAFKFVGLAGKSKKAFDRIIGQVGDNDPDFIAYNKFVTEDVPALATEIIRTAGANSTNAQKATAFKQAFEDNIITNPKIAEENYKELKKLYRSIGKTISKSVAQRNNDLRNGYIPTKEAVKSSADTFKSELIPMINIKTGDVYDVPQGKAQKFLENGFKRK